ncbi:hypothetical protein ACFXCZ_27260 [Streptomyces sp. NPDC059396]|uniref:hypothetical protein n=1 Tax=Streptomyces sp. NPDC059396 TaxID=3346819 RepID=UPI0036D1DE44
MYDTGHTARGARGIIRHRIVRQDARVRMVCRTYTDGYSDYFVEFDATGPGRLLVLRTGTVTQP